MPQALAYSLLWVQDDWKNSRGKKCNLTLLFLPKSRIWHSVALLYQGKGTFLPPEMGSPGWEKSVQTDLVAVAWFSFSLYAVIPFPHWLPFVQPSIWTLRPSHFLGPSFFLWGLPWTCKSNVDVFLLLICYVSLNWRLEKVGANFTSCTIGMTISGLLMTDEVTKLSKVMSACGPLSPAEGAGLGPSARPSEPFSRISPPYWLHLEPAKVSGFKTKCGISMPWVLHFKCQAPKYPLKCRQTNG